MATKAQEKNDEKENEREGGADGPLIDLSDSAVKKLIKTVKKRGYVTMDEINSVLPSEEVSSEQIEDILSLFSEMGVNVVDEEDVAEEEAAAATPSAAGTEVATAAGTALAKAKKKEPTD
ncbi:MAG: RNA polymerase sigma factor region1.1 domain-containing protein, partial [Lentilitoribacter sp.]